MISSSVTRVLRCPSRPFRTYSVNSGLIEIPTYCGERVSSAFVVEIVDLLAWPPAAPLSKGWM